jgi:hypothetical protein
METPDHRPIWLTGEVEVASVVAMVAIIAAAVKEDVGTAITTTLVVLKELVVATLAEEEPVAATTTPRSSAKFASCSGPPQIGVGTDLRRTMSRKRGMRRWQ